MFVFCQGVRSQERYAPAACDGASVSRRRCACGPDVAWNRTTLCAYHHHRGVHAGSLAIRGWAPDGLIYTLGVGRFGSGDVLLCSVSVILRGPMLLGKDAADDTVNRMKTTVEIPDPLAKEAKAVARREKTTLRALIETGLRQVLRDRGRKAGFRLRDASFRGNGFQPGFHDGDWQRIREVAYEDRGG